MNVKFWAALGLAILFAVNFAAAEDRGLPTGSRSPDPDWPEAPEGLYDNIYAPANSSEGATGVPNAVRLVLTILVILIPVLFIWNQLRGIRGSGSRNVRVFKK